ncbi:MAG: deoxyguanosinetriphosphate triphosphohydrolase [Candidatus Acidiferrales bacterium]
MKTPALAAYAMDVARSQGRRFPEPPHPYRNDYARDRDRVIHSRAFRRLEAKTQVFTRRYSDHFRNRLTHTLEVTQIARTVAGVLELNGDLVEALALVHDIGHPPFGHAGEHRLDARMREHGERFDHNLQALRIVEKFEQRYPDFPGLNLTFEVREGIVKHSRDYAPEEFPQLAEYRLAERPPLEAQLIDFVDEIAYNTADLDDGFEAKLLNRKTLLAEVPLFAEKFREAKSAHPKAEFKLIFNDANRRVLDRLATDLIETTRQTVGASGAASVEDIRRNPRRLAGFSREAAEENAALKKFLHARLYDHPKVAADREKSVAALDELYCIFAARPDLMPPHYAELARREPPHRVACDYIAGMTDRFLLVEHRKLTGKAKNLPPSRAV